MSGPASGRKALPHAYDRVGAWTEGWRTSGELVLLLDFDGTLAPIVARPEDAGMLPRTRTALRRLLARPGLHVAIVSGRGLADARSLARLEGIAYAGNHGMEIEGAGLHRIHSGAEAARPSLEVVIRTVQDALADLPGAFVEDKGLTLSIHYRTVARDQVDRVRAIVAAAVENDPELRITQGKEVLEVRPAVDWHKGRAIEFILESLRPDPTTPILYLGDDRTDEDAFRALERWPAGEGVVVADPPPPDTAARAFVRTTDEVAELLELFLERGPGGGSAPGGEPEG